MERKFYMEGQQVVYVDPVMREHIALVTAWHGSFEGTDEKGCLLCNGALQKDAPIPSCNLVFVSDDELKHDTYGRQIERATSVVHKSAQPAHGFYWKWPNE